MTPESKVEIKKLYFDQGLSIREIVKVTALSIWTVYQTLLYSGRPLRKPSKRRRYTQACERKIVDNYEKYGPIKAATLADFSAVHVYNVLKRHSHPTKQSTRHQRETKLLWALKRCHDLRELTIEQGIPWEKIRRVAKKYGIPYHAWSSSGPCRVAQVIRMLKAGHPYWLIAAVSNLKEKQIGNIRAHYQLPKPPRTHLKLF